MEVRDYGLKAGNGRHVRRATMVVLANGDEIRFTEHMSRREAIQQAEAQMTDAQWWAELNAEGMR